MTAAPLRLLVIGLNYAPEQVGIGPYTAGLCETLAGFGHTVEVLAGAAYYPEWRRHPGQPRSGRRQVENGVGVTRCRHFIPSQPTGLKRILHLASFSLSALIPALNTARRLRPQVVFTVAPRCWAFPPPGSRRRRVGPGCGFMSRTSRRKRPSPPDCSAAICCRGSRGAWRAGCCAWATASRRSARRW